MKSSGEERRNSIVERALDRLSLPVPVLLGLGAMILVTFATLVLAANYETLFSGFGLSGYEVGMVADRDVVSPRDVVYEDEEATRLRRDARVALVFPVYREDPAVVTRMTANLKDFTALLTDLFAGIESPESRYFRLQDEAPGYLSRDEVNTLGQLPNLNLFLQRVVRLQSELYDQGVFAIPTDRDLFEAGMLAYQHDGLKEEVPLSSLIRTDNLKENVKNAFGAETVDGEAELAWAVVKKFLDPNVRMDQAETQLLREEARASVEPVLKTLPQGEPILRKDFVITQEDMDKLSVLTGLRSALSVQTSLGLALYLAVVIVFSTYLLGPELRRQRSMASRTVLVAAFITAYVIAATIIQHAVSTPIPVPPTVLLPTAAFAMLLTILVSPRTGRTAGLVMALLVLPVSGMDPYAFCIAMVGAIAGPAIVRGAQKRIEIVWAGAWIWGVNLAVLWALALIQRVPLGHYLLVLWYGAENALTSSILTLALLPLFEHVMNAATPFRLLEFSDMNTPLLKKMLVMAPGTYGHSMSVANLAESACREIGANALLARVGAYYHDIGKVEQPEYFIENQSGTNKHDELKPTLSAAVIKAHVKIGIEKAKELGLPKEVIDIIAQHHGSGVITYFYDQAKKNGGDSSITEGQFSYSGVPPQSKEAAVVMLADGIEAASRVLKKPTVAKLDKFVWSSIMKKFEEGQLAQCDLTFRDLETVKRIFVHILAGYFHSRIEYPEQEESA